jgi:outer membrane protein assembly factor BamD (BamD/ComL family)
LTFPWARFSEGVTARYALARLEELVWAELEQSPDISAVRNFLEEFPKGVHADEAKAKLARLEKAEATAKEIEERKRRETEAWAAVSDAIVAYETFLKDWPGSEHAKATKMRLKELKTGPRRRRLLVGIAAAGVAVGVVGLSAK